MAGMFDILMGSLGTEADYLQQDPFFNAGRSTASWQMPVARTNAEAIFGPALQGALTGALTGYGRRNAADQAWGDYRSALGNSAPVSQAIMGPLTEEDTAALALRDYSQAERPEGWTAKMGRADFAKAILEQEAVREEKIKRQAAQDELAKGLALKGLAVSEDGTIVPVPGYGEAIGKIAAEEDATKRIGKKPEIPAALFGELADQKGIVDEARLLGKALTESKESWLGLRSAQMFSGLDDEGITMRISDLADRILRSRSGAAAPVAERVALEKILVGDKTVTPRQAGQLILKFAEREAQNARSKIDLTKSTDLESAFIEPTARKLPAGAQPTGRTSKGRPVYMVNGRPWVE